MAFVELDRRFVEWSDKKDIDPEVWSRIGYSESLLSWDVLLQCKRVVVLAEAGSGKTEELKARPKLMRAAGKPAFYATVYDVAERGLTGAIAAADRAAYEAWLDTQEGGWFFIDSVDEAKLNNVRLERALSRLADELDPHLGRVHLVLSGRHTDWEFRSDLKKLDEILPIPQPPPPPEPTAEAMLAEIIRNRRLKKEEGLAPEQPIVVVMAGLDEKRVRTFVAANGVTNVDAFISALGQSHLWGFARRPLDLQWLARYWKRNGAFASFANMVKEAIAERSIEPEPARASGSALDADRVRGALRRLAAALVLSRRRVFAIADAEAEPIVSPDEIEASYVLPDWTAPEIQQLARLPVFDPGTFGRTRFHNDNEGIVSAYLAAEWMADLLSNNCPLSEIKDLLFADTYDLALVRPSMRETAAWLSLKNSDIARETAARDPFVLINFGDAGSLSPTMRKDMLVRFVDAMAANPEASPSFDLDSLERFAHPDLGDEIRRLWALHGDKPSVRDFLLRIIWLGGIAACVDIAEAAVRGDDQDRYAIVFGGRAIVKNGTDAQKAAYIALVKERAASLPSIAVWDLAKALLGAQLSVADCMEILSEIDVADDDGGGGVEVHGPALADRLTRRVDLGAYLDGLLSQVRGGYGDIDGLADLHDERLYPALVAAAKRLVDVTPPNEAPTQAVDVALRLGRSYRARGDESGEKALMELLHANPARRRLCFWHASDRLRNAEHMLGELDDVWKLAHFGWAPGLKVADLDWLLQDANQRARGNEKRLAADGALTVWVNNDRTPELLARIKTAFAGDNELLALVNQYERPKGASPEYEAAEARHRERARESEEERAKVLESWKTFVDDIQADPAQLAAIPAVQDGKMDARLHSLWQLLESVDQGRDRYAIESANAMKPLIGAEGAEQLEQALMRHWRQWAPNVRSGRVPPAANQSYSFDSMGVAGAAIEARRTPHWAENLSDEDALRAARYATLELNGFPNFLEALAVQKPQQVSDALGKEIDAEITTYSAENHWPVLESVAYRGGAVAKALAGELERKLRARADLSGRALSRVLEALIPVVDLDRRADLVDLLLQRARSAADSADQVAYVGAALFLDPIKSAVFFEALAKGMEDAPRSAFLQEAIATFFGGWSRRGSTIPTLPFDVLVRFTLAAYGAIRPVDDVVHRGVYTPDQRDTAEGARSYLLRAIINTPGRATYDTLLRFADNPVFGQHHRALSERALERAGLDSEHAAWTPDAVVRFEREHDDTPRTGADLLLLARRRLEDMQHKLTESDFAQAPTLRLLPDEAAVQAFVADRLRTAQGAAYSVEREPEVAEKKTPDIRLRARATDASVAIEIKDMNKDWSLPALESALRDQLCGQYLRDRAHRHGILLLVHRERRPRGWQAADSGRLSFEEVVQHLRSLAALIAGEGPDAPVAMVETIDVAV